LTEQIKVKIEVIISKDNKNMRTKIKTKKPGKCDHLRKKKKNQSPEKRIAEIRYYIYFILL